MNFLLDSQLPYRIAYRLRAAGHDAVHTLDLPAANRTTDAEIKALAAREGRVVVTKDSNFVHGYVLYRAPPRLLLISTGNISNAELDRLLVLNIPAILEALEGHSFVELSRASLIVHG